MNPPNHNNRPPETPASSSEAGPISLVRIQRMRDSLSGRDAALVELIDIFLADLPRRTAAIAAAVERADAAALALHAHSLRGGGANFGAARLDDLCGRLEEMGQRGALDKARPALEQLTSAGESVRRALLAIRSNAAHCPSARSTSAEFPLSH
jgi:HPt (histidine-containing phosphotransfer) domain-containing protein